MNQVAWKKNSLPLILHDMSKMQATRKKYAMHLSLDKQKPREQLPDL
jgi:hypothetical protein